MKFLYKFLYFAKPMSFDFTYFIIFQELKAVLSSVPEIVELVQCADAEKFSHDSEQDGKEKVKQLFESIFGQIMSSNKGIVREAISKLKRRLSLEKKVTEVLYLYKLSCQQNLAFFIVDVVLF